MQLINRIRRDHVVLQYARTIAFHEVDNDAIIAYSKHTGDDIILVVVNLDPHHEQSGWVSFDPQAHDLAAGRSIQVHDLIGDERYLWNGDRHFVKLRSEERRVGRE